MEKIDFVLPWVNGNDPKWRNLKKSYLPKRDGDSNSDARFRDFDTLRFVLRSIERNCPWYNKIYLITEGHIPEWLNINHKKIKHITHSELYFDSSDLPVFNSSSIEMNLPNIKELSDKFVYLNDDLIIMNKLDTTRFFKNDLPVDFISHGWLARKKLFRKIKNTDTWINSLNNNLDLINSNLPPKKLDNSFLFDKSYPFLTKLSNFLCKYIYKRYLWLEHWHHPQPYKKKTLLDVYNRFNSHMALCSKNRFRNNNDLTQYIYRYWHLANGYFYPEKNNDAIIANIDSIKTLNRLIKTFNNKKNNTNFICFNDSIKMDDTEYDKVKMALSSFLYSYFPNPASFEKTKDSPCV